MSCPDDLIIDDLVAGRLSGPDLVAVERHLDACGACAALVSAVAGEGGGPASATLSAGERVGRYEVLRAIGEGAMGVVYAARDPSLDRTVALKLLRAAVAGSGQVRARLQREAVAMAKLTHPNVVMIHEVGAHEGAVYLAMELVVGRTLRAWRAERTRPWRAVRDALAQAGEGVAAAHRAGLVHRDFKPENVIMGDDGRARVTDFGLALFAEEAPASGVDPDAPVDSLTVTGALLGTPAYMAPEQLSGGAADARSDQFSFCVTLFEALHGVRPFEGESVAALRANIMAGAVREVGRGEVPAWLEATVRRGLSAAPGERHATMRALLDAMRPDARRERRVLVGIAAAAVSIALVAAAFALRAAPARCDSAPAWTRAWSADRAGRVRARFTALAGATGASIARSADEQLGRWGQRWQSASERACQLALPVQRACLARQVELIEDATRSWESAAREVVLRVPDGLSELPPTEACEARGGPARPVDPVRAARLVEAERRLAAARATALAGRAGEAAGGLEALCAEAEAIGFRPFSAEAHLLWSRVARRVGSLAQAGAAARVAVLRAEASGDDDTAARAWIELASARGEAGASTELDELCAHADAALTRAGDPGDLRAALSLLRGTADGARGRRREAETSLRAALAWREAHPGARAPTLARILTALGDTARQRGDLDAALALHERALHEEEATRGPEHPELARYHHNRAGVLRLRAQTATDEDERARLAREARAAYERALRLEIAGTGDDAPEAALTRNSLGLMSLEYGALDEARALFARSAEALERARHPDRALVWANQAIVASRSGDSEAALVRLADAERLETLRSGATSAAIARLWKVRGLALLSARRGDEATRAFARAIEIASEHPEDADARSIEEEARQLRTSVPMPTASAPVVARRPRARPTVRVRQTPAAVVAPAALPARPAAAPSGSGSYGPVRSWDPG